MDSKAFKMFWFHPDLDYCRHPQMHAGQQERARGLSVHLSDRQDPEILPEGFPVHIRPWHRGETRIGVILWIHTQFTTVP